MMKKTDRLKQETQTEGANKTESKRLLSKKIGYGIFVLVGFLCAFFWKTERDLAAWNNILWTGSYVLRTMIFSLLVGASVGVLFCFLLYGLAEGKWTVLRKINMGKTGKVSAWKVFLFSLLVILVCWLPCYFAYYPAICSYDITIQTGQIESGAYNDHHPIAHTLLLKGAMELGGHFFGSINAGIGVYAALQMIMLAACFAYGITVLHQRRVKRGWLLLLLLYGMLYPFHWYMSISTIKDTVFSAFFLLQMLSLYILLSEGEGKTLCNRFAVLFVVSTVGMMLFRNNGKYAMLVLLFFLLLTVWRGKGHRRFWGRIFSYAMLGFLIGNILLSVLFSLTRAQQGDKREMLSMPIQQMARCMIYHGGVGVLEEDDNTISWEDKSLINDFLLDESYKKYRPDISDPVKSHTNTYVPRYRVGDFISTYLHLFAEYPGDYLNAVLAVNAGYLSPGDVSHAFINENGSETGLGYVQTRWVEEELNSRGIYKASKWETLHERLEKWADDNAYLNIPVLKYLFVPGSYLWLYLLFAACLLLHKKCRMLLPLSLTLGYYITLFLGPTVQLRYLYPLMITLPFMALFAFAANREDDVPNVAE